MQITAQDYISNPCRVSSLPYWKSKLVNPPDDTVVVHDNDYNREQYSAYSDELFFRLMHNMNDLSKPNLPQGYRLVCLDVCGYAKHINECYSYIYITSDELKRYVERDTYSYNLWIAVMEISTGNIVATGIAEYDPEIREGILEWVQVSDSHRNKGLGTFLVNELLHRLRYQADFVTVSGKVNDVNKPERLYRKCGFNGTDIWHVLVRID